MPTIPLRLDPALVNEARTAAPLFDRTPTAQVEFWAKLGKVAEAVFSTSSVKRLKATARIENLAQVIADADTAEGRARFAALVHSKGVPLYRSAPGEPGFFIETAPDGTERRGRFVNRKFQPLRARTKAKSAVAVAG
ncbi:MAG TPA: hypothetical protein VG734_27565 [Lacunisphaera sp.]|nr:hypothetical protein [Lacunisphaera sp.]